MALQSCRRAHMYTCVVKREGRHDCQKGLYSLAKNAFAIHKCSIKHFMPRIAPDGTAWWRNGATTDDTVRAFQDSHGGNHVQKSGGCQIKGRILYARTDVFRRFKTYLWTLPRNHTWWRPFLCNVDKAAVDATTGAEGKVFWAASAHHGAFADTSSTSGPSKHIAAVVAVSGSGRKAPPLFMACGKGHMKDCTEALISPSDMQERKVTNVCSKCFKHSCFPQDEVIKMSKNGIYGNGILAFFHCKNS